MNLTQTLIGRIRDELKALKASTPLNLGQLNLPSSAPSVSYSGSINTSSSDLIIARFVATFTRSDDESDPPYVDFAFNMGVSPTYQQYIASQGGSLSGNDLTDYEDFYINGRAGSTGTGSNSFIIEVKNAIAPWGTSPKTLSLSVQAISTVPGTLTLERTL